MAECTKLQWKKQSADHSSRKKPRSKVTSSFPDILYPEQLRTYLRSSSPIYQEKSPPSAPNPQQKNQQCLDYCAPKRPGYTVTNIQPSYSARPVAQNQQQRRNIPDFILGQCKMEESFRVTLMQYFEQVDKEKQGLTEDLRRLKEDFFRYEEEKIRYRNENVQKDKVIRRLAENGKLFVAEIERLKGQVVAREKEHVDVIAENNELRKRVAYDHEAIPHLESELKNLAEENQYLKLLSDDTKLMQAKDEEIRKLTGEVANNKQTFSQWEREFQKQTNQLAEFFRANEQLGEHVKDLENKIAELRRQQEASEAESCRIKSEQQVSAEKCGNFENRCNELETKLLEKANLVEGWERGFNEQQMKLTNQVVYTDNIEKRLDEAKQHCSHLVKEGDEKIRSLEQELAALKLNLQEKDVEIGNQKRKIDLLNQNEKKQKSCTEELDNRVKSLQQEVKSDVTRQRKLQQDLNEGRTRLVALEKAEATLKKRESELESEVELANEARAKQGMVIEQLRERHARLEEEILEHVQAKCQLEQEKVLNEKAIETLKRTCDSDNQHISTWQSALKEEKEKVRQIELELKMKNKNEDNAEKKHALLKGKLESCEDQRNRLQKEVLTMQEEIRELKQRQARENEKRVSDAGGENLCDSSANKLCDKRLNGNLNKRFDLTSNDESAECSAVRGEWKAELSENNQTAIREDAVAELKDCEQEQKEQVLLEKNDLNSKDLGVEFWEKESKSNSKERILGEQSKEKEQILQTELLRKEDFINELAEELTRKEIKINELQNRLSETQENSKVNEKRKETLIFELEESILEKEKEDYTDLREELVKKQLEIEDLEDHCNKLRSIVDNQQNDIDRLFEQIDTLRNERNDKDRLEHSKNTTNRLEHPRDKQEDFRSTKDHTTEKEHLVQPEVQKNRREKESVKACKFGPSRSVILQKPLPVENTELTSNSIFIPENFGSLSSESDDHHTHNNHHLSKNSSFDILSETKDDCDVVGRLRFENKCLKSELELLRSHHNTEDSDLTTEDYNQFLEVLDQKNCLIEELQQHIYENCQHVQLYENYGPVVAAESTREEMMSRKTRAAPPPPDLKLPKPDIITGSSKAAKKPANLPSTPSKHHRQNKFLNTSVPSTPSQPETPSILKRPNSVQSTHHFDRRPTPSSSGVSSREYVGAGLVPSGGKERNLKFELEKRELKSKFQREIRLQKERDQRSENEVGGLRTKVAWLNNELIDRQHVINKLEEEVKAMTQKNQRNEDAYKNSRAKNDQLEREIAENRRQISEIADKRNTGEVNETRYKRELTRLNVGAETLSAQCDALLKKRDQLENRVTEQDSQQRELSARYKDALQEIEYWKRHSELAKNESVEMSKCNEALTKSFGEKTNACAKAESTLDATRHELTTWKEKALSFNERFDSVLNENREMRAEILAKSKLVDDMRVQVLGEEQQRGSMEGHLTEYEKQCNDLRLQLLDLQTERRNTELQKNKMEVMLQGNSISNKELLDEKDMAENNLRYLKHKNEELSRMLQQKEQIISRQKERDQEINVQLCGLNDQLREKGFTLQTTTARLEQEMVNVQRLEKLSADINGENKKLMKEQLAQKARLQECERENNARKSSLDKFEREQTSLDNMILKTQKSNSELMENNEKLSDEVRSLKQKLSFAETDRKNLQSARKEVEFKLTATDSKHQDLIHRLTKENKELLMELQEARDSMAGFEAILDQGQSDFDELEAQLEAYRRENVALDEKLHEVLKEHIRLKTEHEEMKRKYDVQNNELSKLTDKKIEGKEKVEALQKQLTALELECHETKSREQFFEERLKGYEDVVRSKEETLCCEKKEKDTLQTDLLKFQRELIECKSRNEVLLGDNLCKSNELSELKAKLDILQNQMNDTRHQSNETAEQTKSTQAQLEDSRGTAASLREERNQLELKYAGVLKQLHETEARLEEEQTSFSIEREKFMTELSAFKRNTSETEVSHEKLKLESLQKDNSLQEAKQEIEELQASCRQLEAEKESLGRLNEDMETKLKAQEADIMTVKLEHSREIVGLRHTVEELKDARVEDLSLIQSQVRQTEEVQARMVEETKHKDQREIEAESLRYDIRQLQSTVETLENRNGEARRENQRLKEMLQEIEQNRMVEMVEQIEEKDKIIEGLQDEKTGKEQEIDSLTSKITELKQQVSELSEKLQLLEEALQENESLKYDLEAILDERLAMQQEIQTLSKLRADNFELQTRAERVSALSAENRALKEELHSWEARYHGNFEKLTRDNRTLQRSVDDLFKKNQDLELRNVGFIRTTKEPTFMRGKATSYDNISDTGGGIFDTVKFSSTPTPVDASPPQQQRAVENFPVAEKQAGYLLTSEQSKQPAAEEKKPDAGYATMPSEVLNLDIQENPFLQRDKHNNTRPAVMLKPPSPKKQSQNNLKLAVGAFDMRPQSATNENAQILIPRTPTKPRGVGNEFVNKLKQTFEKQTNL